MTSQSTEGGAAGWIRIPKPDGPKAKLELPPPIYERYREPQLYDPGEALTAAMNVSLMLGQPLLLTGEPGCGKTALAYWLAYQMGLEKPLAFAVKSTTSGKDLLYSFDDLARFRDAQAGADNPPEHYLRFNALGLAILSSKGPGGMLEPLGSGDFKPKTFSQLARGDLPKERRQVVLIDELDKAPRDTPNDLLSEIEQMSFALPELGGRVAGDPANRPVVVITSNSDKSLPEPFLRRCIYYNIPPADAKRREEIVRRRNPPIIKRPALMASALATFETLRDGLAKGGRAPGIAELLAWLDTVDALYPPGDETMAARPDLLEHCLSTVAKTYDDSVEAKSLVAQRR